ncbi:MAG: DNA replication/repair protein RecF [Solirubrobacterales bacterium]
MRVEQIAVLGFRNLADSAIRPGAGVTVLWGPNGAGKTNWLEAAYMALAGRSCRTRDDRELIAFGAAVARAEARVAEGGQRREFLAAVERGTGRRQLVDGTAAGPEAADLRPPIAVFMPDRLALVKGPPAGRRSHLDRFCAALRPASAEIRRRYARALAQRNALLARIRAGAAPDSLDAWDLELATAGVDLMAARADAAERLALDFTRYADELGLDGEAQLRYRPRCEQADADGFRSELERRLEPDIARGYTGWGPHLDELALELGGRSLRRYGSQGEQRIALLALLFAERGALIADRRPTPLMLLDDVTSELDGERRRMLFEALAGDGQALLTATGLEQLPSVIPREEIAVRDGRTIAALADDAAAA